MSGLYIAVGYGMLIAVAGWWGVLAVAVHVGIMLAAVKR